MIKMILDVLLILKVLLFFVIEERCVRKLSFRGVKGLV